MMMAFDPVRGFNLYYIRQDYDNLQDAHVKLSEFIKDGESLKTAHEELIDKVKKIYPEQHGAYLKLYKELFAKSPSERESSMFLFSMYLYSIELDKEIRCAKEALSIAESQYKATQAHNNIVEKIHKEEVISLIKEKEKLQNEIKEIKKSFFLRGFFKFSIFNINLFSRKKDSDFI